MKHFGSGCVNVFSGCLNVFHCHFVIELECEVCGHVEESVNASVVDSCLADCCVCGELQRFVVIKSKLVKGRLMKDWQGFYLPVW